MLDFACGHGRGSRFFVARLGSDRVTVSDINGHGVAFCGRALGVPGFVSCTRPYDLEHEGRYDAIFSASLFSHLPRSTFSSWIDRLLTMLNPDGLLIFSTHGNNALEYTRKCLGLDPPEIEPGFRWAPVNETSGRLDTEEYGSSFVTDTWVQSAVTAAEGSVLNYRPRGMNGFQDLYTVTR
jgi:SAM-dependent methyltransferase